MLNLYGRLCLPTTNKLVKSRLSREGSILTLLKQSYSTVTNAKKRYRSRSCLNLFELIFVFDGVRFNLIDKTYTAKELLNIYKAMVESLTLVGQKGFVPLNFKINPMFAKIKAH